MNNQVVALEPSIVWRNFEKLNAVPRPSKKEQKVIKFVKEFCESLGLETIVDHAGNVICRKAATKGYENLKMVVLQAHIDMVHQKNSDTVFDFDEEGIKSYIEGGWVKAEGTTLGADNGMGVAAMLAVLESKDLEHGPLEMLFTIDEETGMTGAFELKEDELKAAIMINLDTEQEGEITVGCAGGIDTNAKASYKEEEVLSGYKAYKLSVTGLKGGHSGVDIHLGRANANKLIARLLYKAYEKCELRISSLEGGSLRNAIPREAFAVVYLPEKNLSEYNLFLESEKASIKKEFSKTEPKLTIALDAVENSSSKVLALDFQSKVLELIYACPNGVIATNKDIVGLVDTSTNLASVKCSEGEFLAQCLTRSVLDSAKIDCANSVRAVFELMGATVEQGGEYPGWTPNLNSEILKLLQKRFEDKFSYEAEVLSMHAGLECGILGAKYPEMDIVSFGPTIKNPHSPDECVEIRTVKNFWELLIDVLKHIPTK